MMEPLESGLESPSKSGNDENGSEHEANARIWNISAEEQQNWTVLNIRSFFAVRIEQEALLGYFETSYVPTEPPLHDFLTSDVPV